MNCPYCGRTSRVVDSRPTSDEIRRRRECEACGRRFTTYERVAPPEIRVLKARGRKPEGFDRAKLVQSIRRVCKDRPVTREVLDRIAKLVEVHIADLGVQTIKSALIAELVLDRLKQVDQLTYRRFAVNYVDDSGEVNLERTPDEVDDGASQYELFDLHDPPTGTNRGG